MVGASSRGSTDPTRGSPRQADRPVTDVGHDRQILIVGDGLAAAASAGFLHQAGLDPVQAVPEPDSGRAGSLLVTIWQPGLALLERLGLRRPIERVGTRVTGLETVTGGGTVTAESAGAPGLVAIRRDALRDLLGRQTFSHIRQAESPVRRVRSTEGGVQASFASGVEEQFDTVLTSSLSTVAGRDSRPSGRSVRVWEFEWPETVPAPSRPVETWLGDRAAFLTPLADGTRAQLVAATGAAGPTGVRLDELRTRFGPAFETVPDPFPALDQYDLEYRQPARVAPTSLSVDGVTLVGAAARAAIPEGCLGPALGIEDAWVAADTLAYGPAGLERARRAYETRRRDRERDIEAALADSTADDRAPRPLSPPLRRLYRDRRLAFSHVIDGVLPDVAREIPARL